MLVLLRLNTEILVEFGDSGTIRILQVLDELALFQQEDAGGDICHKVEVVAGDDDRSTIPQKGKEHHIQQERN